jgi:hypothetical protein
MIGHRRYSRKRGSKIPYSNAPEEAFCFAPERGSINVYSPRHLACHLCTEVQFEYTKLRSWK